MEEPRSGPGAGPAALRGGYAVSADGALQKKYRPCDIVLVDEFLDRTKRDFEHTFFGRGIVAHVTFAHPICEELRQLILKAGKDELHASQSKPGKSASRSSSLLKIRIHDGGTYVNIRWFMAM